MKKTTELWVKKVMGNYHVHIQIGPQGFDLSQTFEDTDDEYLTANHYMDMLKNALLTAGADVIVRLPGDQG